MTQKMVENPENYTGIFDFLPKMTDFQQTVENVPNYLVFYFRDRQYIFAKLLENPKLLPKRMALLHRCRHCSLSRTPLTPFHSHPRTCLGTTSYLKWKAAICGQFQQLYDTKMQQAFNDRKVEILFY